ncbi:ricin-type beta-trefoil lectin domain protein [Embleya sp. NPDC005971]|uniref:ricin-type beta-trefoil lectin domain protein n=1 Tax=Embleya sp. NPDC005971 TaxID=3156724 RepID=UPI0033FDDC53
MVLVAGFAAAAVFVGGLPPFDAAFGTQDDSPPAAVAGVEPESAAVVPESVGAPSAGAGWRSGGAVRLSSSGYTFRFHDRRAVAWLGPYVERTAAELRRITGLPIAVDTEPAGDATARGRGDIVVGVLPHPCLVPADGGPWRVVTDGSGTPDWSCGFHTRALGDTVVGGQAFIDASFFRADGTPIARFGEAGMRNHISHELGHTLGLAHADDAPGGCPKGADSAERPVMCTSSNGYQDSRAGRYVQQFDVQGLRALAAAGAPVPPQGRVVGIGGRCLEVEGGTAANGTPIRIRACDLGPGQSWILERDGTLRALGKCLDNAGNRRTDGNRIQLFDCNDSAAQKWMVDAQGRIVHVASGGVLDVAGGKSANGTAVQLYSANGDSGQLWRVPT